MPDELKNKTAFISDMDGVIYHGNNLLPGAADFVRMLEKRNLKYLFLTNSSERTPRELAEKLARLVCGFLRNTFIPVLLPQLTFSPGKNPAVRSLPSAKLV